MDNKPHYLENIDAKDPLRSQGYVILKDLVPGSDISRLNDEMTPWFDQTPKCQGDFYGWDTTRFGSVLTKAPTSQKLATHPAILKILDTVLGPSCDWYQLNLSQGVRIHPGAPSQPAHRDEDMWPGPKSFEYLINVMWPVDDFTAENGATRIWPKNKVLPPHLERDESQAIAAEVQRGSALVFLGSVLHSGGANVSSASRTGLILSYSLGWLKSYENQFLAYPPHVAREFSKEIQDLIGYRIHRPNLGGYENQCPSVLFDENCPGALPAIDSLPPEIAERLKQLRQEAA